VLCNRRAAQDSSPVLSLVRLCLSGHPNPAM
jgi:hypothetical protein